MKEFLKKHRLIVDILMIMLVALIVCAPMFSKDLDVYKDDGVQHIARAYGTSESIKLGLVNGKVINSFGNGFGYSWNLFYGALSTYIMILINFVVNNFIVSYKIVCILFMILSGFTMYRLIYGMVKNENAGLLGAIIYMSFPYHLTDLYFRNALCEFMSFAFIPLVFLGINNILFEKKDKYLTLTLGAVGLVLTHNISTIYTCIFAVLYLLVNIKKVIEPKVIKNFLLQAFIIVLICSSYIIPLLETSYSADYGVYEKDMMTSVEKVMNHSLSIKQLFVTENEPGAFVFELGPHVIIIVGLSILGLLLITGRLKGQYIFFLVAGFISLFMTTKYFPWKYMPNSILMIQFAWRMLMFVGFFFSIICAINMYAIIKRFNIKDVIVIGTISVVYTGIFIPYLSFRELDKIEGQEHLGKFYGVTNECIVGAGRGEYLPKRVLDNKFYLATREDDIYTVKGKALVEDYERNGSKLTAKVKTYEEATVFELPFIYYPGYEVRVDGMLYDSIEGHNGFLCFAMLGNDDGILTVEYTGTEIMHTSALLSVLGVIAYVSVVVLNIINKNTEEELPKQTEKTENA